MISLNYMEINYNKFPNGELHIETKEIRNKIPYDAILVNISWNCNNPSLLAEEFQVIKFIKRWIDENCYTRNKFKLELSLPYVPYSRMDRNEGGKIFTLKLFTQELNDLKFDSVNIIDPHSEVTPALINKVEVETHKDVFDFFIGDFKINKEEYQYVYPDLGAYKKYTKQYGDGAYCIKNRDWETGKINNIELFNLDLNKKEYIIIDDLCSRGGTFVGTAKLIKEKNPNAKVTLVVSHMEDSVLEGDIPSKKYIDRIATTGSILSESTKEKLTEIFGLDFSIHRN